MGLTTQVCIYTGILVVHVDKTWQKTDKYKGNVGEGFVDEVGGELEVEWRLEWRSVGREEQRRKELNLLEDFVRKVCPAFLAQRGGWLRENELSAESVHTSVQTLSSFVARGHNDLPFRFI